MRILDCGLKKTLAFNQQSEIRIPQLTMARFVLEASADGAWVQRLCRAGT
jgi:hypothetical protein